MASGKGGRLRFYIGYHKVVAVGHCLYLYLVVVCIYSVLEADDDAFRFTGVIVDWYETISPVRRLWQEKILQSDLLVACGDVLISPVGGVCYYCLFAPYVVTGYGSPRARVWLGRCI